MDDELYERLQDASARLVIELASLLPPGTDVMESSVAKALVRFKEALVKYERSREAV